MPSPTTDHSAGRGAMCPWWLKTDCKMASGEHRTDEASAQDVHNRGPRGMSDSASNLPGVAPPLLALEAASRCAQCSALRGRGEARAAAAGACSGLAGQVAIDNVHNVRPTDTRTTQWGRTKQRATARASPGPLSAQLEACDGSSHVSLGFWTKDHRNRVPSRAPEVHRQYYTNVPSATLPSKVGPVAMAIVSAVVEALVRIDQGHQLIHALLSHGQDVAVLCLLHT
eukprot:scaffold1664_cov351-Prasinococcus_capsulatus_cf.AAC.4